MQLVIHIISDALGDSAMVIAEAASSQFNSDDIHIERLPNATQVQQVVSYIDSKLEHRSSSELIVIYTFADADLRSEVREFLTNKQIAFVDALGPAIETIAAVTGLEPKNQPGLLHRTDKEYFRRVGAMEFAVYHDDGRAPEELREADIVLIGASRTSKTPLSVYLALQGYKVANVPLAPEVQPPKQLFEIERARIFGLTSEASLLADIRLRRLGNATHVAGQYADPLYVQDDLDQARTLMRRLGVIVIRTDNRAIEETSQEILRYYEMAFPDLH
ncbi:phosphoenolpyruvate synthase regulatory protein [Actinomycetota bacterium]|nr:phosphoenolpyruvate synthase regulatory protein [Actinomycetota bacterium]